MYEFNRAPFAPERSPVPPALADLMRVASMETPEGQPTVAAQYAAKAQQPMMQQGMPQDMQGIAQGMPGAGPSVQGVAQNVARGNQIQADQQQQQQQEMMQAVQQLLQQQQGKDNAMRFGVAAAPGADTVRMAEGGIVGYAEGDLISERLARIAAEQAEEEARTRAGGRFDPRNAADAREMAQRRAAAQAALGEGVAAAAPAAAAAEARGVGNVLGSMGRAVRGGGAGLLGLIPLLGDLFYTSPEDRRVLEESERARVPKLGGGRATPAADERLLGTTPPEETAGFAAERERNLGQIAQQSSDELARAEAAARQGMQPPAPPKAGIASLQAPAAPAADRRAADAEFAAARNALAGIETGRTAPADIVKKVEEQQAAYAPYLRSQGVDPDQYKKDLATSEERRTRRLSGIEALEAQSKEARTGTNRMIEFLAGGAGRVLPGALGQQHVNMLRRDLAENERFNNARERVMEAEDNVQAAIREKRRAEVMGDIKAMETAEVKDRDARNAQRIAQADLSKELGKALDNRIEKGLDRSTQVAIENLRAQVHREATKAQQEGTLEIKRANILANLNKTEEAAFAKIEEQYQKRTAMLTLPGKAPTKQEQQELQDAAAERDLAKAAVRKRLGETRDEIMSMGGGGGGAQGGGGIKVERVK